MTAKYENEEYIQLEMDLDELARSKPLFFWLGADGEAEEVSPDEFEKRIEAEREAHRKWEEVDDEGLGG